MRADEVLTIAATVGLVLVLGLLQGVMPVLSRPGLWFAVTVPVEFRRSPEAKSILTVYRAWVAVHCAVALALVFAGGHLALPWMLVLGLFWLVLGSTLAFLGARRRSLQFAIAPEMKREVQVRPAPMAFPGGPVLQVGPFAVLAALAAWLRTHWGSIPQRFPIHFGLDGRPNAWATKSAGSVYGLVITAVILCLVVAVTGLGVLKGSRRISARGLPAEAETRFRNTTLSVLLGAEYLVALELAGLTLQITGFWHVPVLATALATFAFVIAAAGVLIRIGQGGALAAGPEAGATDLTPDSSWKWGLFYVNRNDPAVLVEKRFGIGYTLNFGSKWAWAILGLLLALPFATRLLLAF